ncbi:hypothetical protein Tco_1489275, partial [Tanacetum coccineum]
VRDAKDALGYVLDCTVKDLCASCFGNSISMPRILIPLRPILGVLQKIYIDNLERLGHPVSQNLAKTVNELHAMLKLYEQTLPKKDALALHAIKVGKVQKKNNKNKKSQLAAREKNQGKGKSKLAYVPKPKIPPPPKKEILLRTQSVTNAVIHAIGSRTVPNIYPSC